MSRDFILIAWQGGITLGLLLAVNLLFLIAYPRFLSSQEAPLVTPILLLTAAAIISGVVGIWAENWLFYALLAIVLTFLLVVAALALAQWCQPTLMKESGSGVMGFMFPWLITGASLVVFGLVRLVVMAVRAVF